MIRRSVLALLMTMAFLASPAAEEGGPRFDLIFGVHTYAPGKSFDVDINFYVDRHGELTVEYKPPDGNDRHDHWISLYRYSWKTKTATLLITPGPEQFHGMKKAEYFGPVATEGLHLIDTETSPDGYRLAEPRWVAAGPVSQVLGNLVLLGIAGRVERVKERETMPRIERGSTSFPMKGSDVLPTDDSLAFPIGWVKP